jgi:hypothetical protein
MSLIDKAGRSAIGQWFEHVSDLLGQSFDARQDH